MMNKLSNWFNQSIEAPTVDDVPHELELATAALMMEVARADFEQSEAERSLMLQKLGSRLKLTDEAVAGLLLLAQDASEEAHDLYSFTSIINERFTYPEKKQLVVNLWEIALADAHIDPQEDHIIRRIAGLLSVDHSDVIHARAKARDQ
ncbi:MAG: TerB family tellurite resistance protein [Pseudomonadales bacterium]|nr:TerB family tellurite resistance protein [Pseudomonadales bacterium]